MPSSNPPALSGWSQVIVCCRALISNWTAPRCSTCTFILYPFTWPVMSTGHQCCFHVVPHHSPCSVQSRLHRGERDIQLRGCVLAGHFLDVAQHVHAPKLVRKAADGLPHHLS